MNHQLVFFIVVLPLFFLIFNLARFIVILLHELSHAVPALIFTKNDVNVYIGHNKNDIPNASRPITIGMLKIYIAPRFIYFNRGGFCVYHSKNIDLNQELIIISSGACVTAVISVVSCYIAFKLNAHAFAKLTLLSFCVIALFSLVKDLYPRKTSNPLLGDDRSYSDGNYIIDLLNTKANATNYIKAVNFYNIGDYKSASAYFSKLINRGYAFADIYRKLISSLIMIGNYEQAHHVISKFLKEHAAEWQSEDYYSAGLVKSKLNLIDESIAAYSAALKLNPKNKFALNNRGSALNAKQQYFEAIADFDAALLLDNTLSYAYCNRGFAKMKTGQAQEGLKDVKHSLILDENNGHAYFKIGIYHFDKRDFDEALIQFKKAKQMDNAIAGIDQYIDDANRLLAGLKH